MRRRLGWLTIGLLIVVVWFYATFLFGFYATYRPSEFVTCHPTWNLQYECERR